jgi:glycosyltransferase involved in cell wall biosynthesis
LHHHPTPLFISKQKMKLLVLAQTPPPLHGQSLMVQTLVDGLPAHGIPVHHVNLGLSRDSADIGRWRAGKAFALLAACVRAVAARFRENCDTLYYVPAPGKRGALWRDWTVMILCRPFFKRLVLHWHASGLDEWLATRATTPELGLTRLLLGRADLSIVLAESLRADAAALTPRRIAIVPNGIADPGEPPAVRPEARPFQVLFLGLCSEEKGLFTAASAILAANRAAHAPKAEPRFVLVAAGSFPDFATGSLFEELCRQHPAAVRYAGPVHGAEKTRLFRTSHCFCLPTRYPAEGQPLVLLEAMAHDLPVAATHWRAIRDTVPAGTDLLPPDAEPEVLAELLAKIRRNPVPGTLRSHYLAHFTLDRHLQTLAAALTTVAVASKSARGAPAASK